MATSKNNKVQMRQIVIDQDKLVAIGNNVFAFQGDDEFVIILARRDGAEWETEKMYLNASSGGFKDIGQGQRANVIVGRSKKG